MTTLRNEPTHSPTKQTVTPSQKGEAFRSERYSTTPSPPASCLGPLYRLAHLEDRQVHGHHDAADEPAEDHHDHGFHQRGERIHGLVHFLLEEIRHLAEHRIE